MQEAHFISQLAPALATGPVHISHSEWVLYSASSHLYWLYTATSSFDELHHSISTISLAAVFNVGEKSNIQKAELVYVFSICKFHHRRQILLPL